MPRPVKIMLRIIFWVGFLSLAGMFLLCTLLSPCSLSDGRAERMITKANMHTVQLALEDFAVQTGGRYPSSPSDTTPGGETVIDLMLVDGRMPENPYTGKPLVIHWNDDPTGPGEIAINPADSNGYMVKGHDKSMPLPLELTTAM